MLTRRKKLVFGFVTLVLVLLAGEVFARVYSAVRYNNEQAVQYGWPFIQRLREGTAKLDVIRTMTDAARAGDNAERLFERRKDGAAADGLAVGKPGSFTVNAVDAHINSLGYRGDEFPVAASGLAIATFGGSYVWGAYLQDNETWPYLLGVELRRRGRDTAVMNGANNGANVHGVLEDLIRITNRIRVDAAVITSAYNNHALLPLEREWTLLRTADFYLYNLSMLEVLLKEKLGRLQGQPLDYASYRQRVRVDYAAAQALFALYDRRLAQIHTVCTERRIRLILAAQPEVFFEARINGLSTLDKSEVAALDNRIRDGDAVSLAELEFYLQGRFNQQAQAYAAGHSDVLFFNGDDVLRVDKRQYFHDQIHPTPAGARVLAGALADFLDAKVPIS